MSAPKVVVEGRLVGELRAVGLTHETDPFAAEDDDSLIIKIEVASTLEQAAELLRAIRFVHPGDVETDARLFVVIDTDGEVHKPVTFGEVLAANVDSTFGTARLYEMIGRLGVDEIAYFDEAFDTSPGTVTWRVRRVR